MQIRWIKQQLAFLCGGAFLFAAIPATGTEVKTEPAKQAPALPNVLGCVLIGAGAEWWMTWYLNGGNVFDTAGFGNEFPNPSSDNFVFPLKLKKGTNILAVHAKAGGRGLRLAAESRDEIDRSILSGESENLKLDPQLGLVVQDPKARCLAKYPATELCGFAGRRHDGWNCASEAAAPTRSSPR